MLTRPALSSLIRSKKTVERLFVQSIILSKALILSSGRSIEGRYFCLTSGLDFSKSTYHSTLYKLEMNRVAFRSEGRFMNDFTHRRVGVDGGVDFIAGQFLVEGEAHFRNKLGGVFSDNMSTE